MKTFLRQLFASGAVTVPPSGQPFDPAQDAAAELLAFDDAARLDFPGDAPVLDRWVAVWAALRLAEIARLVIARDLGEPEIAAVFAVPCPAAPSPETDYSADLFLRYLPGLAEVVERLSPGDPLLQYVAKLGADWPLSSPGMKLAPAPTPARIDAFASHRGLLQLYADRILTARDQSRLGHPVVDAALRASLGAQPQLCPVVAEKLGIVAASNFPKMAAVALDPNTDGD